MSLSRLALTITMILAALSSAAQREVTPVESDDKKPAAPTLHYYDKHGDPLDKPVLFLSQLDTLQVTNASARPVYPKLHSLDFGINFFDGILLIAGQHYCNADVWASLSMWNWLFPTVEIGLGAAHNTPKPGNFTYKGKLAPYIKVGADYNFLYKSDPRYRVMLGLRVAYSTFSYDVTDITIDSPYWQESQQFSLTGLKSHAWWGEVLAGLRVNIWHSWSLGWTFRYHTLFGDPPGRIASPWFIPGYGSRSAKISATFSIIYTLPLRKPASASQITE